MGGKLTRGRRPVRGYKHRMNLDEVYERLQWGTPTEYEMTQVGFTKTLMRPPVHIGTSAHMLIELYLDMAGDHGTRPAQWLVVCKDKDDAQYLQKWLKRIDHALGLPVQTGRVTFFPLDPGFSSVLDGHTWYSWAIFCDHPVKEQRGHERNMAPYRFVRSVEPDEGCWIGRDREGNVVCHLTQEGMNELVDAATCPVTIVHDDLVNTEVTYAAADHEKINEFIRLRKSYQR